MSAVFFILLVRPLCLLSDAEILEDIAEDFVGGDFAGDFADVLETLAEVLRQKVA